MRDVKIDGVEGLYRRGKEYVGRVSYRDDFGKRHEVKRPLGTTEKSKAKALLGERRKRLTVDHPPAPRRGTVTVEKLLEAYMAYKETQIASGHFRRTTWNRYQRDIEGKINPTIGQMPIHNMTADKAERFLLTMRQAGREPRSRGREHTHDLRMYSLITRMRTLDPPHTYSDIVLLIGDRFPEEAASPDTPWLASGPGCRRPPRPRTPPSWPSPASTRSR